LLCEYPPPTKKRRRNSTSTEEVAPEGPGETDQAFMRAVDVPRTLPGQLLNHAKTPVMEQQTRDPVNLAYVPTSATDFMAQSTWNGLIDNEGNAYSDWPPLLDGNLTATVDGFDIPPLSYINWMSPPYQDPFDWDSQPAFAPYVESISSGADYPLMLSPAPHHTFQRDSPPALAEQLTPRVAAPAAPSSDVQADDMDIPAQHHKKGAYYIDGGGYRAPFRGLSRQRHSSIRIADLTNPTVNGGSGSEAGTSHDARNSDRTSSLPDTLTVDAYQDLLANIRAECLRLSVDLDLTAFPSLHFMRACLQMYIAKFQRIFPILQFDRLRTNSVHWLLLLAMCAVGATYINSQHAAVMRGSVTHVLWTITLRQCRTAFSGDNASDISGMLQPMDQISIIQAYLLTICSLLAAEDSQTRAISVLRYSLMETFHDLGLFNPGSNNIRPSGANNLSQRRLDEWIDRQTQTRSVFMFWVSRQTSLQDGFSC
jgi:hypothetical protein